MAFHTATGDSMSRNLTHRGFTLIELLVVMAIIVTLLTIAVPRYLHSVDRSREAVLHQNLALTRQALDKYFGDNGKYPDSLDDLVSKKYLRSLPFDPITDSNTTWLIVAPEAADKGAIFDIRSGATGQALDGTEYKDW
jgi:general secretion pathway protein G